VRNLKLFIKIPNVIIHVISFSLFLSTFSFLCPTTHLSCSLNFVLREHFHLAFAHGGSCKWVLCRRLISAIRRILARGRQVEVSFSDTFISRTVTRHFKADVVSFFTATCSIICRFFLLLYSIAVSYAKIRNNSSLF
jgi:hypothetical protein